MDKILETLGEHIIYGWHTKKVPNTIGLINLIGTPNEPVEEFDETVIDHIWNTKCDIDEVELFMDVGKVYLKLSSLLTGSDDIRIKWGVWIKIPNDKHKYAQAHKEQIRSHNISKKRKRDDHNIIDHHSNKHKLLVQHDLLESRTLAQLYDLTKSDGYIQLGDVTFTHVY